jgi:tagaturonate reductase
LTCILPGPIINITMKRLNRDSEQAPGAPEKIIQFGEGNFLRAFVDWMVQEMNKKAGFNASVAVVQPIEQGRVDVLNEQDGLCTLVLKGLKNGEAVKEAELITSISRGINPYSDYSSFLALAENPEMKFIVSNTTEAGIAFNKDDTLEMQPPASFPAKLTSLLYHRFTVMDGDPDKGFIILPCELINRNGDKLEQCVHEYCKLWSLGNDFRKWLDAAVTFTNTLVDRIVPGYNPDSAAEVQKANGYDDQLVVDAEQFHLWVIEGPEWLKNEIPAEQAGLNILFTDDVTPYRTRKVRLLNGPHTVMVPIAWLCGIEYVGDAVDHEVIGTFIVKTINNEIIPALDMNKSELQEFAANVLDRFRNPFVEHALLSISLNSVSKYKARVLDTVKEYLARYKKLPENLIAALAALILFYRGERNGEKYPLKDDDYILQFFADNWKNVKDNSLKVSDLIGNFLSDKIIWAEDLTEIEGLKEKTVYYAERMLNEGMTAVIRSLNSASS